MLPTLGQLGPITLYTYTVLLDLGVIATLAWLWWQARRSQADARMWFDAGLWAVIGGIMGARFGYVIANWTYYGAQIGEALAIWTGGLAAPGAMAGAIGGLAIYSWRRRAPFGPIFDALALPGLLVAALGWAGCAAAGCAAGLEVLPGQVPFAVYWPDIYGIDALRWPAQLLGAGFSLLALGALAAMPRRDWPVGRAGLASLALIALSAFLVGWIRGDEMPAFGVWRLDVIAYGLTFVLSITVGFVLWALQPPATESVEAAQSTSEQ
ncbi:MAG: prolipoprotein diacylglyceryl transferase [Anaerolineales bacterium]